MSPLLWIIVVWFVKEEEKKEQKVKSTKLKCVLATSNSYSVVYNRRTYVKPTSQCCSSLNWETEIRGASAIRKNTSVQFTVTAGSMVQF